MFARLPTLTMETWIEHVNNGIPILPYKNENKKMNFKNENSKIGYQKPKSEMGYQNFKFKRRGMVVFCKKNGSNFNFKHKKV